MPGGKEKRRQICRKGKKEMRGEFEGRENENAGGGGRVGKKVAEREGALRFFFFFFPFLLSSKSFWLVPSFCFIFGKRDETECESRENAA